MTPDYFPDSHSGVPLGWLHLSSRGHHSFKSSSLIAALSPHSNSGSLPCVFQAKNNTSAPWLFALFLLVSIHRTLSPDQNIIFEWAIFSLPGTWLMLVLNVVKAQPTMLTVNNSTDYRHNGISQSLCLVLDICFVILTQTISSDKLENVQQPTLKKKVSFPYSIFLCFF